MFNVAITQFVKDHTLSPALRAWCVGRFPVVKLLHLFWIRVSYLIKPSLFMSTFTHSFHVYLLFVSSTSKTLQVDTHSLLSLGSTKKNHVTNIWENGAKESTNVFLNIFSQNIIGHLFAPFFLISSSVRNLYSWLHKGLFKKCTN